jgi:hypothetical protein
MGREETITPVPGGYMIRIDGFPVYELGFVLGPILRLMAEEQRPLRRDLFEAHLGAARESLRKITAPAPESYLPPRSKAQAEVVLQVITEILAGTDAVMSGDHRGRLMFHLVGFNETLASELQSFDLYWVEPKLGYNTSELLTDGTVVFPKPIRDVLPDELKHEVREAARCLEYEVFDAVGFHILRAVELTVLDYFTLAEWSGPKPTAWNNYARSLKKLNVHRKIRWMIVRLSELHRNELLHAEAVLSAPEASMLFALMQEVMPVMIADVAKRKGAPIANFPILDDPRWQ